jgi:thiamine-monophosphate kinase
VTVGDLTERDLIARIQAKLPPAPSWLPVGIGDDAAVVEPERNRLEVLSVDTIVEGVHFDRAFCPPDVVGHRALAVNLSDLAAMGAAPRAALLAMALPAALEVDDFDGIVSGLVTLAAEHRLHVVGGNLTRSPGPLVIDVTVTGTVKRRQVLTRGGAKPGDAVYVSGAIGAARAGLALLQMTADSRLTTDDSRLTTDDSRLTTDDRRLTTAYLRPSPRVRLGVLLARNRAAGACIDLSDGLSDGVHRIAEASRVGIAVDADALPIPAAARAAFASRGCDPVAEALAGGDDYELLFTVRRRRTRSAVAAAKLAGIPITRIGECTERGGVVLRRAGAETPLSSMGYSHFGAASPA